MQYLDDSTAPKTSHITTMPPPSTLRQQSAPQHTSFAQTTPGVPLKRQQSTQQHPQQKQPRAGTSSSIGACVSQKQFGSSAQSHVQQPQQQQQQKQPPVFLTPAAYAHSKQTPIDETPQATSFSTTGKGKIPDLGILSNYFGEGSC
ncbi:hypothetical protein DFJ73DRAFT_758140 [Zopfochytrium polystomum]|nr:hypothetical protein DFJ73DRAFT_758140 [Zopfochytrium polystomum]